MWGILAFFDTLTLYNQNTLPEHFVESWVYSSSLSVVEQCDTWAQELQPQSVSQDGFNAGKGELTELARNQVGYSRRL